MIRLTHRLTVASAIRTATVAALVVAAVQVPATILQAQSTTYQVATWGNDANAGTPNSPFRSIARALSVLRPGDTVYIRGGVYTEALTESHFQASGTSAAWIVVAGYPGETATLRNPGAEEILRFQDGSRHHIEFRDLIFDGSSVNVGQGITTAGRGNNSGDQTHSHDLRFVRLTIRGTYSNGMLLGGYNHEVIDSYFDSNGRIPYATYTPGATGIYAYTDNSVFRGNRFFNGRGYAIRVGQSNYQSWGHASGNVVERNTVWQYGSGKGLNGNPDTISNPSGGLVTWGNNNTFRNNVVFNVGGSCLDILEQASGIAVYNNTFYDCTGYPVQVGLFGAASGSIIKNNVFAGNHSGDRINSVQAIATDASHNYSGDPGFRAPGSDFRLNAGSVAIDAGVPVVQDDFTGSPRPSGAGYDLGAYEFVTAGTASTQPPAPPQRVRCVAGCP